MRAIPLRIPGRRVGPRRSSSFRRYGLQVDPGQTSCLALTSLLLAAQRPAPRQVQGAALFAGVGNQAPAPGVDHEEADEDVPLNVPHAGSTDQLPVSSQPAAGAEDVNLQFQGAATPWDGIDAPYRCSLLACSFLFSAESNLPRNIFGKMKAKKEKSGTSTPAVDVEASELLLAADLEVPASDLPLFPAACAGGRGRRLEQLGPCGRCPGGADGRRARGRRGKRRLLLGGQVSRLSFRT